MKPVEFTAKTTEEAIAKASSHFNLPLNRLEVEVISAGSSGFFGILGKKAQVLVRPQQEAAEDEVAAMVAEMTGSPQAGKERRKAEKPRDTRRFEKTAPRSPEAGRPMQTRGEEDTQTDEQSEAVDNRQPETPEVIDSARKVLVRLLEPLEPDAEVSAQGRGRSIELEIEGGDVGMVIGRRGQTLEALQYLTTRIVSHLESRPVRINVDAGGYRRRRVESLEDLARRMAKKAKANGKAVGIGPFPSQERRVIHLALRGEKGISTVSRGRGELKKVIIAPR